MHLSTRYRESRYAQKHLVGKILVSDERLKRRVHELHLAHL